MKFIKPIFTKKGGPKIQCYYESEEYQVKVLCVHECETFPIISELLDEYNIDLFIELGTARGGTTLRFHDMKQTMQVHTFDISNCGECQQLIEYLSNYDHRITFHKEDILTSESETLLNLLSSPVKKMLYCDNGNKPKEIRMYSKYLSSGDLLGVHDWGKEIHPKDVNEPTRKFTKIRWSQLESLGVTTRLWVKN